MKLLLQLWIVLQQVGRGELAMVSSSQRVGCGELSYTHPKFVFYLDVDEESQITWSKKSQDKLVLLMLKLLGWPSDSDSHLSWIYLTGLCKSNGRRERGKNIMEKATRNGLKDGGLKRSHKGNKVIQYIVYFGLDSWSKLRIRSIKFL